MPIPDQWIINIIHIRDGYIKFNKQVNVATENWISNYKIFFTVYHNKYQNFWLS